MRIAGLFLISISTLDWRSAVGVALSRLGI
jgi:hypothetical protein